MAKRVDDVTRSEIGELTDDDLRIRIEEGLIKRRKLKLDAKAYADAARDVISAIESDVEGCIDEASARSEKRTAAASPAKVSRKAA